jgi:hypothetical protein
MILDHRDTGRFLKFQEFNLWNPTPSTITVTRCLSCWVFRSHTHPSHSQTSRLLVLVSHYTDTYIYEWMGFNIHLKKSVSDRLNRSYLNPLTDSRVRSQEERDSVVTQNWVPTILSFSRTIGTWSSRTWTSQTVSSTDVTRVLQMLEVTRNASCFADTIEYTMFAQSSGIT